LSSRWGGDVMALDLLSELLFVDNELILLISYYEAVFLPTQHTINFIDAVFITAVFLVKDYIISLSSA
jgi:hypothetical protein